MNPSLWIDHASRWYHDLARQRSVRSLQDQIDAVNHLEPTLARLSDNALRDRFRTCAPPPPDPETPDAPPRLDSALLVAAFACVREAVKRSLGMRPYDVQIMAGLVMARGELAEMATGEGKTLVATLPASVLALTGRGVHVTTVNAYLAERDHALMQPVFQFLGLSSALLPERARPEEKRAAYAADITYGTGYEFGFDYLRDQLMRLGTERSPLGSAWQRSVLGWKELAHPETVQRPFACAVVDEIDSVLIDEAVTPLIISRPAPPGEAADASVYRAAEDAAAAMDESHYEIRQRDRSATLTPAGLEHAYRNTSRFPSSLLRRAWHEYIEQALRARLFFKSDHHYLIRDEKIEIIDENTGRAFADRKWRGGLHQAVEAAEGLPITSESESDVTVSRQRFYRLYPFLCGMTGTARENEGEFLDTYQLRVIPIPRHRPLQRRDLPDRVFSDRASKTDAIVAEVLALRRAGRPVLIGTRTVRRSDEIARALQEHGIHCAVLNARQDQEEADLIHLAGQAGRITIATNMAGRGADIPLGEGVAELGGLHVIGEERNDSRRVDRQLAGRAGRQGDAGSSQFFLSYEDELTLDNAPPKPSREGEQPASAAAWFAGAQLRCEAEAATRRAAVMRQDQWLDKLKRHT
ncbi:MAG: helicase-related protein [Candidatus Methylacidiphilales bacterium]